MVLRNKIGTDVSTIFSNTVFVANIEMIIIINNFVLRNIHHFYLCITHK